MSVTMDRDRLFDVGPPTAAERATRRQLAEAAQLTLDELELELDIEALAAACPVCAGDHPGDACPHGEALELDLEPAGRLAVIIPCSAAKATLEQYEQRPAGEVYTGSFHRYARAHAERLGADIIVIASAEHGLIGLDKPITDYNRTIEEAERLQCGMPRLVTRTHHQAQRLGLLDADITVVAFLPKRYAHAVAKARVPFVDILAGSAGIGEQRGRINQLTRKDIIQ